MAELAQNEPRGSSGSPALDRRQPVAMETAPFHAEIHVADSQGIASGRQPSFATVLVGRSALSLVGLARILDKTNFRVVASATNVDHLAPSDVQEHEAVLLILDAGHDVEAAMRQVQLFKQLHATPRIAVIIGAMRLSDMASLFKAGANVCFAEGATPEIFLKSLELVILGETLVPSTLLASIRRHKEPSPAAAAGGSALLSTQEERVLRGLVDGHQNKAIGRDLGIAETTVKVHVKAVLRKIGVVNRTQAAMWAMRSGSLKCSTDNRAPAPFLSAGEMTPPIATSSIRDESPPELPPAASSLLGDGIPGVSINLSKPAFVQQSRVLPSERRLAEEQERRDEFIAKTHRLRELREARDAVTPVTFDAAASIAR